jgi:hypothetical protein
VYQSDCSGRAGSSAARDQLFRSTSGASWLAYLVSLRREGFSTLRGSCSVRSGRLASRVSSAAIVSLRLSRRAARKKPAISSIGIRQSKTRLLSSDDFSAAAQMFSHPLGESQDGAQRLRTRMCVNGSLGFAKSRKSNARHAHRSPFIDPARLIGIVLFCADASTIGCFDYCVRNFPLAIRSLATISGQGREVR